MTNACADLQRYFDEVRERAMPAPPVESQLAWELAWLVEYFVGPIVTAKAPGMET